MIRWKKTRREPLPNGTILSFLNGEEFVLQDLLAENKNACSTRCAAKRPVRPSC